MQQGMCLWATYKTCTQLYNMQHGQESELADLEGARRGTHGNRRSAHAGPALPGHSAGLGLAGHSGRDGRKDALLPGLQQALPLRLQLVALPVHQRSRHQHQEPARKQHLAAGVKCTCAITSAVTSAWGHLPLAACAEEVSLCMDMLGWISMHMARLLPHIMSASRAEDQPVSPCLTWLYQTLKCQREGLR